MVIVNSSSKGQVLFGEVKFDIFTLGKNPKVAFFYVDDDNIINIILFDDAEFFKNEQSEIIHGYYGTEKVEYTKLKSIVINE